MLSALMPWFSRRVLGKCLVLFTLVTLGMASSARELSLGDPPDSLVEDKVEQVVQDRAEDRAQQRVQDIVEERTLTLGDAGFENTIALIIEEQVQNNVEQAVEDTVADNVDVVVEGNIEDVIEQNVETTIETNVDNSLEDSIEQKIEDTIADNVAQTVESAVEVRVASAVEQRLNDGIDDIIEKMEVDEGRIQKDQWLVMADPEVFEQLAEEGYLFDTVTDLPGMGLRLAEVAAPSSFDISKVRQGVIDIVGRNRAEVDLNHIYTAGDQLAEQTGDGILPRVAIDFPADTEQMPLRIGMIDSRVDVSHPSLHSAHIHTQAFTDEGADQPSFHGTAIASIIAGKSPNYEGIAPNAEVYAASVFQQDTQRGEIASTVSLVRALDWLISSGVDVINISLAGPPNRLLEAALQRASQNNVMILAAAGNGGPSAEPMYPAAYKMVVAVTAVDDRGQVFRLANRGDYLDIAAPGVGVRHAKTGGGYTSSSGTSFAVPFAAIAVARLRQLQPGNDALAMICSTAEDLGPPGRDSIYGFGLLRPEKS